jgi:hypothetical protein
MWKFILMILGALGGRYGSLHPERLPVPHCANGQLSALERAREKQLEALTNPAPIAGLEVFMQSGLSVLTTQARRWLGYPSLAETQYALLGYPAD